MSSRAATVTARDEHEVALLATWCFFSNHGWTRMKGVDGRFGACFVSGDALVAGCDWHTWLAAKGRSNRFAAWQEPRPPAVVVRTKREGDVPPEPHSFCERQRVSGRLRFAHLACSKGEVEEGLRLGRSRALPLLFAPKGRAKFHLSRACFVNGDALVAGCDWHSWLAAKGRSSGFAAWQEPRPPVVVRTKRQRCAAFRKGKTLGFLKPTK